MKNMAKVQVGKFCWLFNWDKKFLFYKTHSFISSQLILSPPTDSLIYFCVKIEDIHFAFLFGSGINR